MEYEWRVSEREIQLVNTQLHRPIESAGLYNLAKELVRHPSKYADIIRTMRERSALHHDKLKSILAICSASDF
jgi:hypothetical protein